MLRIAFVIVLSALLSACFASDRPLFAPESAVRVLGDGGKYATFELVDGKENPSDSVEIRPHGANAYDFIDEKGATTPVTFHPLPDGRYVGQAKLDGNQGYGYLIVRIDGAQIVVTPIECNKQDDARMASLGVVRRSQYECGIDAVADPSAFFAGLKPSEPVSRMVRQQPD
jgi:major membrane immunogen (membrane-anchored lipoprotein)